MPLPCEFIFVPFHTETEFTSEMLCFQVAEMLSPGGSAGGGVSGQLSRPAKDPNWLTLEVCREYARNKCGRAEEECKFAHPPPHIDIQNGRVTCCFDSLQVIYHDRYFIFANL